MRVRELKFGNELHRSSDAVGFVYNTSIVLIDWIRIEHLNKVIPVVKLKRSIVGRGTSVAFRLKG